MSECIIESLDIASFSCFFTDSLITLTRKNCSVLPRRSGVDSRLLDAVPFQSSASLEVEFTCPNKGIVRGMGISAGVSLIIGGGHHGKSTLMRVEVGVYNHLPGGNKGLPNIVQPPPKTFIQQKIQRLNSFSKAIAEM